MNTNMMRAPLYKAAAVLLFFAILAYLTSASPDGGVLNSVGQIIIGVFRFVQWIIAMAIGLTFSIAVLIAIFLFAVSLVNKASAAAMYQAVKAAVLDFYQQVFSRCCSKAPAASASCVAEPVQLPAVQEPPKEDLSVKIAGEIQKVADSQQALNAQFSALNSKIQSLEEKSTDFVAASQLEAISAELASTGKTLGAVQENVVTLEGRVNQTLQQVNTITPEKILGDIPARLQKLETSEDEPGFDPAPLTTSIQTLQKEVEELKKKGTGAGKAKKKA